LAKRQSKAASAAASAAAWRQTAEGQEKYRVARAQAQAAANADGMDRGIEWRDIFKQVTTFMLPRKHRRFGHEIWCEVVMTERQNAPPGHGSSATRPPSLCGSEFHGGPFDAAKNRERAAEWHAAHPEFDCDFSFGKPDRSSST
jgi:hypothetical protein